MTKTNTITFPGWRSFQVLSLKDRNQFYDPLGRAKRLGISSALWPLFGVIWPSGVLLASKVIKNKKNIQKNAQVLEIGCGLALASIVAHSKLINVTASDYHPAVPGFLRKNLMLNKLPILPYRYGRWGAKRKNYSIYDTGALPINRRYDLVMGSDLLYEPDSALYVAEYIDHVAKNNAEVWLVDPNRGYKNKFVRELEKYQFHLVSETHVDEEEAYELNGVTMPLRGFFMKLRRGD